MKRILITTTALALLGMAFIASRHGEPTLTARIDDAVHDLEKAQAPIPHVVLHAKALEILQARTVAAGEEPNLDPCIAFDKKPIAEGPCK